ncbi:MAG: hypothetical protein J6V32_00025 [Elusimicrobiaceae bacterium]|nr:hypothetical protein [Elusimicrobiaceae bacterium]
MKKGLVCLLLLVMGLATVQAQDVSSHKSQLEKKIMNTVISQNKEKLQFFQAILDNDMQTIEAVLASPQQRHFVNATLTRNHALDFLHNGKRYGLPAWGNGASRTPLMLAAEVGSVEAVKKLLRAGAAVNTVRNENWTALCFATNGSALESDNRFELEQILAGKQNQTRGQRQAELVEALLKYGADPAKACGSEEQVSPLYMAVEQPEYLDIVKMLGKELKKKGELDSFVGQMNDNPLGHAVWAGNKAAMEALLSLGANPNGNYSKYNQAVVTPAFQAVYSNRKDMLETLIKKGGCACAYYDKVEHVWTYAVDEANRLGYDDIVTYLRNHDYGSASGN